MSVIYLNAAHTPYSPGGVYKGINEHEESLRLCGLIRESLLALDGRLQVEITAGNSPAAGDDDLLFVFHKGNNMKNECRSGALIFVKESASAEIQYRAFRLLCALCGKGLSYRGVHTATKKSPFCSFINTIPENAYLVMAGFIESDRDNSLLFHRAGEISLDLAGEILKIYKEKTDEDKT